MSHFAKSPHIAWFTDTLDDVNGVARTIRAMSGAATRAGKPLTVITCRGAIDLPGIRLENFSPLVDFKLPAYKAQTLTVPPARKILNYLRREKFTEVIISTPGPVGLAALLTAKLLGLRTVGIDHTDFPQYARFLTGSAVLEGLAWRLMDWFYGAFDLVYVNSECYRRRWTRRGFDPQRLGILPRGLDTQLFDHRRREENFWRRRGADRGKVLLYVGRVSKEKELEFLAKIFHELSVSGAPIDLAIVGEGPYRAEMQKKIPRAIFTGPLGGGELGAAYASADLFLFPSTTDTFGNVVLEAAASGLPVFVSDIGGPKELLTPGMGQVLPAGNLPAWATAVRDWLQNPTARDTLTLTADQIRRERNWDTAFEKFWALTVTKAIP
ncbi:MAG: glycosyltransferase family 1 protein [Verrucomicrobiales bacterium]|jgi:glycosyltransferase involved in cell wall biosynthesis|nr:glycosyltransferase family 1 protein [Verrucomicrobiales bacterium]